MSRSREGRPAARLRRTARGWAEQAPTQCPKCNATLGAGTVLVGTAACRCGQAHRTHFCRSCEFTVYSPAQGPHCLLLALDERNMRAQLRAAGDQAAP